MSEITIVKVEPDWAMMFVDGEVALSNHSLSAYEALREIEGETVTSVTLERITNAHERDCGIDEFVKKEVFDSE